MILSEEILDAMRSEGKNIQQEQSYVVGDAIYCADSEELIKEHSERSGAPYQTRHNTSFVSYLLISIFNILRCCPVVPAFKSHKEKH